jgi:hypothetical protein
MVSWRAYIYSYVAEASSYRFHLSGAGQGCVAAWGDEINANKSERRLTRRAWPPWRQAWAGPGVWSGIRLPSSTPPRLHLIHDERLLLAAWTAESLESRAGRAHAAESAMQRRTVYVRRLCIACVQSSDAATSAGSMAPASASASASALTWTISVRQAALSVSLVALT